VGMGDARNYIWVKMMYRSQKKVGQGEHRETSSFMETTGRGGFWAMEAWGELVGE